MHSIKEKEGKPRSKKLAQKLGAFLGLSSSKKHSQHQAPQHSNPQIPGVAELPNNPPRPGYATYGQNYTDTRAAPPMIAPGYSLYLPQEPGQPAHIMPQEAIPGPEIIIALMGVTGKI